jgi:hypothetical protein
MSEAIQPEQPPYPGEAWTEIVRRPTLEEFSLAFASDVVLEASVVSRPILGPIGLFYSSGDVSRNQCIDDQSADFPP